MAENKANSEEQVLLEPYNYQLQVPGKQIRLKLAEAFNYWLKIDSHKLGIISEVCQMLHNASLLIDDIEDHSLLRRGIPAAYQVFGLPTTLNCGNYVYFLGLEKALTLKHEDVPRVFTEQLLELHRGQGMEIYWRDSYTCPTEVDYKKMVIRKTGGLFGLAVRLMQLFSSNKSDLKPLQDSLGLFFQIRDDYANILSKEYESSKSFAEDLTEGKFSFPIIHGIHQDPSDTQILNILRKRTNDVELKKYCIQCLHTNGSVSYTKETLLNLEQELYQLIDSHGGNPYLTTLVKELSKIYKEKDS